MLEYRLDRISLNSLPEAVQLPQFDPATLETPIVHLGVGAFHRGQMAWYTQLAMHEVKQDKSRWGIRGVSLNSPRMRELLAPQDFLYTLASRSNQEQSLEVIGALTDVVFADDDPLCTPALLSRLETKLVSLTITEKGYCHDPATGELNERHPGIVEDLAQLENPTTAIGIIALGLQHRKLHGAGPVSFLSCDNLPANGKTLARIIRRYCELAFPDLLSWIDNEVSFPSTMVDRIVPAITAQDQQDISNTIGVVDRAPVIAEAHSLWVVEDDFRAQRPCWDSVGVKMVGDVTDYETLKLRLLNGPHSACAYLGYLAGYSTVAELMQKPIFPNFLARMMGQEIIPGLDLAPDIDVHAYKSSVLERFANTALAHKTQQIAMDGSQKLPQRLLNSVRAALQKDLPIDCLCLSIAAWMRYVTGTDEAGQAIEVSDPMADRLNKIALDNKGNVESMVHSYLSLDEIFPEDLLQSPRFVIAVSDALESLFRQGALASIDSVSVHPRG